MSLTVGSLFSGIGGVDLGLERAGMRVVWQSEIDPYACRVLAKHWPDVPNLGDITTIDWSTVEPVDLICGGYPCQPFSLAGVRRGESDPRHLWPYFHRAIRDLRPRYALLENVPGHLSLGFDRVLGDLAEIGYDTEWCSIPAAAVGAPHLRWRIFAVAYPQRDELRQQPVSVFGRRGATEPRDDGSQGAVAHADILAGTTSESCDGRSGTMGRPGAVTRVVRLRCIHGRDGATEPRVGRASDGLPEDLDRPWRPGWEVGTPRAGPERDDTPDRLRCLGNAVVPQVAQWIGERIMEAAAA